MHIPIPLGTGDKKHQCCGVNKLWAFSGVLGFRGLSRDREEQSSMVLNPKDDVIRRQLYVR